MKILYITNRIIDKSTDLEYLSTIADLNDDLIIKLNNEEAITFINERLIKEQKHLDIIVIDFDSTEEEKEDEINEKIARWIRPILSMYSEKNFQLKSIPIILFKKFELWRTYRNSLFDNVIYQNSEKEYRLISIGKNYDNRLNKIADDLEFLRLDTNLDFKNFNSQWLLQHRFHKLEILSEHFILFPRKLKYLWFGKNSNVLEVSLEHLNDLLKKTDRNPNLRIEKQFHQYFLKNIGILYADQYGSHEYEKQLYYQQSKSYIEPDFINFREKFSLGNTEIMEVKNPNQKFTKKDGDFYRNINKAFNQVHKYKTYLTDENNYEQIKRRLQSEKFNRSYKAYDYTLLTGRSKDKEENEYFINKNLTESKQKIKIKTFDDLIKRLDIVRQRIEKHRLL